MTLRESQQPTHSWQRRTFYVFLLALFATWFGGFTFYAAVVVPIGTETLGSARAQGEITQQVSDWLNVLSALVCVTLLAEHVFFRKTKSGLWNANFWVSLLLTLLCGYLFWLNRTLDGWIETTSESIRIVDRDRFYASHRIYLWVSSIQWLLGWVWLFLFSKSITTTSSGTDQKDSNF